MGKILIYLYEKMADFEMTFAAQLLNGIPGKQVITVADDLEVVTGTSGIHYQPEATIEEVELSEVDALIIPGGYGSVYPQSFLDMINELHKQNKLIAAICAAPRYLAKAGILKNNQYTTSLVKWTETEAKSFGAEDPFPRENFVQKRVVIDNNIITSQGYAFVDFAIEILDWFQIFESEEEKTEYHKQITGV